MATATNACGLALRTSWLSRNMPEAKKADRDDEPDQGPGEGVDPAHGDEHDDGEQTREHRREQGPAQHGPEGGAGVRLAARGAVGHRRSASSGVVADGVRDGL